MNDEQLLRYSRQVMLPQIDIAGQARLFASHVLIVGAGGLGSPASMYLAAAGIGHISIADDDTVELSNLQRQLLHRTSDLDRDKAISAGETLAAINPDCVIDPVAARLAGEPLERAVAAADVVLDCSDNYPTRFDINRACVALHTPLVSGAAVRFYGQLAVFDNRDANSPCYRCLYEETGTDEETCAENGVLAPVVGIIGAMQAMECIKLLLGIGEPSTGRLQVYDGLAGTWRTSSLPRDPACPACSGQANQ